MNPRRLYRSDHDRVIAGVCGGVADYFEVDPTLVRVLWVALCLLPFPTFGFWAYVVMAIVVPPEPTGWSQGDRWSSRTGPSTGYPATYTPPAGADPAASATPPEAGDAAASDTTQTWTPEDAGAAGAGATGTPGPSPQAGWTAGQSDWQTRQAAKWDRRQERWQRRQERWEERRARRAARPGSGGLLFGLLLILVGGVLLWHQIDPALNFDLAWPVIIVLFGVVLIAFSLFPGRGPDR